MKYDFNAPIDRSRNSSLKHEKLEENYGRKDIIPMWVADMDVVTAQPILDALKDRVEQGIFGYTTIPESYFKAARDWKTRRNGWTPDIKLMSHALGVVPALNAVIQQFSKAGDEILFCTPVYNHFFESVINSGRKVLTSSLKKTDDEYNMDFSDFEEKLKSKPAVFILCSPHNPVGRVWSKEELTKIGELCLKYGVLVIADEIHSDIVLWGNKHIPFASLSKEIESITVTCISATKSFNLAGLHACTVISPNLEVKEKIDDFWNRLDLNSINCFAQVAMEAAFKEGDEWMDQLITHLEDNITFTSKYIEKNIPKIKMLVPQGTYLLWLDCKDLNMTKAELMSFMVEKAGIALNAGDSYGEEGKGFMRMNVACPKPLLEKALNQLKEAVNRL